MTTNIPSEDCEMLQIDDRCFDVMNCDLLLKQKVVNKAENKFAKGFFLYQTRLIAILEWRIQLKRR